MSMKSLTSKVSELIGGDDKQRKKAVLFLVNNNDIEEIKSCNLSIDGYGEFSYCYTATSASAHRKSGPREVEKCGSRELDKSDMLDLIDNLQKK